MARTMSEPVYFILAGLLDGPLHGYGIVKLVEQESGGRVRLAVGTLYGALERLTESGLVELDREETVQGRPRRYYRITDAGRESVAVEAERMRQAAQVVTRRTLPRTAQA
ncbi:PadR family transcriptional regulator [Spirillospora sp. NPDC050679]